MIAGININPCLEKARIPPCLPLPVDWNVIISRNIKARNKKNTLLFRSKVSLISKTCGEEGDMIEIICGAKKIEIVETIIEYPIIKLTEYLKAVKKRCLSREP